jgi:hypothetical protein
MKTFQAVLSWAVLICAATPVPADAERDGVPGVSVAAGSLDDAVESLAKQTGVGVMYVGSLLDGKTTAGVEGTLAPRDAFARLLEGTSLILTEERGAFRLAAASRPAPVVAAGFPMVAGVPRSVATSARWMPREIRGGCAQCDWSGEFRRILTHLGASEIVASPQVAVFLALVPAASGDGDAAARPEATTHWATVTFGREGRWPRDGALGVSPVLYDELLRSILPLFTTRNVTENDGRIAVDVLVAGTAPAASECHRVVQGRNIQRYCGSPDQWLGLQVRVGFRCSKEGKRDELCASAAEWRNLRKLELMQSTQRALQYRSEAAQSVERNQPTFSVTPSVGAPVSAPTPAPSR